MEAKQINFRLTAKKHQDVIDFLEEKENISQYIVDLIRKDMSEDVPDVMDYFQEEAKEIVRDIIISDKVIFRDVIKSYIASKEFKDVFKNYMRDNIQETQDYFDLIKNPPIQTAKKGSIAKK